MEKERFAWKLLRQLSDAESGCGIMGCWLAANLGWVLERPHQGIEVFERRDPSAPGGFVAKISVCVPYSPLLRRALVCLQTLEAEILARGAGPKIPSVSVKLPSEIAIQNWNGEPFELELRWTGPPIHWEFFSFETLMHEIFHELDQLRGGVLMDTLYRRSKSREIDELFGLPTHR